MGGSLAWLHLSDWHQRGPDFERRAVRDALLDDLKQRAEIDPGLERIDFVVFSGDLAFSGHPAEYETAAKEFLDPVLEAVGVVRERLFMVPGNHDLSRSSLRLLGRWLDAFPDLQHMNAALFDPYQRRTLLSPMEGYAGFVRGFFGAAAVAEPAYGFLSPFEVRGIPIALVGMNTAWLSGQRIEGELVNDYGVLALGEPQFHQPMQDADFLRADVRIGVLHHPFSWLGDRFERSRIEQTLTRGFHFLLRGHEHEARVAIPNGTDGACAILSAGAAYDRRDRDMNGYNFVQLDLDKGRGIVFLRRYDIRRGFLKDTNTTGDATPGYHRFRLPRKVARAANRTPLRRPPKRLVAERVRDHRSLDVVAAVELYAARIPASEQVTPSDIIRFLREDEERLQAGFRARDFLFVAKQQGEVCGFALLHSNAERRLAFVAYLVAMPGLKGEDRTISATLLEAVAKLFEPDGELADHSGILLDVEDPRKATSPEQARERLARLRLFWTLAEREGFLLRALDFPYRQPLLHLPQTGDRGRELPLLLMFAQPHGRPTARFFSRDRVLEFLDFMYRFLFPEGFSPLEEENVEYRSYLEEVHAAVCEQVPAKVPAIEFGEFQGWPGDPAAKEASHEG